MTLRIFTLLRRIVQTPTGSRREQNSGHPTGTEPSADAPGLGYRSTGGMGKDEPMLHFIDDDPGYLRWVSQNRDGYVVNAYRNPTPAYLMLHRATCRTITGNPTRGRQWTGDYMKACGSLAELRTWASQVVQGELRRCQLCG